MEWWFHQGGYSLTVIADNGGRFADFSPYVASINNNGVVAFQASLRGGGSGVFVGDESAEAVCQVCSHPDINDAGDVCFYSSGAGVILVKGGRVVRLAESAGPLGPTMNNLGAVAYRAAIAPGVSGIFTGDGGPPVSIAQTGGRFRAFQGLPVVNGGGAVVFRADLDSGGEGILVSNGDRIESIVETGERFVELGLFPIITDSGAVAFCATLRSGGSGLFLAADKRIEAILASGVSFESFRGLLVNNSGQVVFYATPRVGPARGRLGIFTGPDPVEDCLLAEGASFMGSTVAEFALNPVSINDSGQIAIRVKLADGRQFILRADPVGGGTCGT